VYSIAMMWRLREFLVFVPLAKFMGEATKDSSFQIFITHRFTAVTEHWI
jgi:hypothetical protein